MLTRLMRRTEVEICQRTVTISYSSKNRFQSASAHSDPKQCYRIPYKANFCQLFKKMTIYYSSVFTITIIFTEDIEHYLLPKELHHRQYRTVVTVAARPAWIADTLPRFDTVAVQTAGFRYTLITVGTWPTWSTPAFDSIWHWQPYHFMLSIKAFRTISCRIIWHVDSMVILTSRSSVTIIIILVIKIRVTTNLNASAQCKYQKHNSSDHTTDKI